ncbi:MAG: PAS domain-containing protein [Methanoregula sp.]|jgi:PAS domain S-box-containing protein
MKVLFETPLSEQMLASLTLVFMGMFSIMALWEIIIQDLVLGPGVFISPVITLVIAGLGAAFIAYFPLRALRQAENRFKAIFEMVPTGIVIIDPAANTIVDANPRFFSLFRVPKEKVVGSTPEPFLCREDTAGPDASPAGVNDDSWQKTRECSITTAENADVPVIRTVSKAEFSGKTYHIESYSDISDLKKARVALTESKERYKNIVQTQTEFICRFRPDGTHIFVNDAYCRYFNKSCSDFVGHRFKPEIPKEDQLRLKEFFAAITPENPTGTIEHRIIMPDRSIRWQQWNEHGLFDASGTLTEYQSVGRDITQLKEAEENVKKGDALLRSIFHGSPNPQFVIDPEHRVLFWTRTMELYTGLKETDALGSKKQMEVFYPEPRPSLADLLVDGTIEQLPEFYGNAIRKSALVEGAYEAVNFFPKMGGGTWLYFTATPLRDENGVLLGAFETASDITALKTAEAEVKKSHERYLSYIKEAAMRLKTPVEVVRDNLSLLKEDVREGDSSTDQVIVQLNLQVKNLEQIRHSIINLNKTIIDGFGEIPEASKKFLIE